MRRIRKTRVFLDGFDVFTRSPIRFSIEFVPDGDRAVFLPLRGYAVELYYTEENARAIYGLLKAFAERVKLEEERKRLP